MYVGYIWIFLSLFYAHKTLLGNSMSNKQLDSKKYIVSIGYDKSNGY